MGAMYLPLLLSALALLISIFSFFYFKSYLKRRTGQERILAELREEVNNILRSINETTDRDISLIEEREKDLKSLLNEIEKRMKVYIRELERRAEAENTYAALSMPESEPRISGPTATYEELGKNRYRGRETEADHLQAADRDTGPQETSLPAESEPEAASPSMGEQIRSLVRSGLSTAVIASRLGISIAEVEFAAALLERRRENF